jgi:DNA-binding NtrC family response regulator
VTPSPSPRAASLPHPVLVVDDDADVRSTVAEYLTLHGFQVGEAANGLEALVSVKRHRPRAVILDLEMPRLGGADTLRYIRAFDPTIAVVIITGAADPEVHRQAQSLGRVTVLPKPLELAVLVRILQGGDSETGLTPEVTVPRSEPVPEAGAAPAAPRRTVLIVDDDEGIREVLEELLAVKGFETLVAANAVDAVRVLGAHVPSVILLDIDMPGLSGLDALPTMIAMAPSAAVIMVSGTSDEELARQTLARGAFDYVIKPIDVGYLMRSIDTALAATSGEA